MACLLVPKKPKEWLYATLLHNIGWDLADDCGSFLVEDGTVQTVNLKEVDKAMRRVKVGKGHPSEILAGLSRGIARVSQARKALRKKDEDAGCKDPQVEHHLNALMTASKIAFRETTPVRLAKPPKAELPTLPKSIFPLPKGKSKTKVAARSGIDSDFDVLNARTDCGWVQGTFKKFVPRDAAPYVIRWSTKPPSESNVTAKTMKEIHKDYQFCADNQIFDGIVGKELLWPTSKEGCKVYLRYVKVLRCLPCTPPRPYVVSYRDGTTMTITGQDLDRATTRHDNILQDKEVPTDFSVNAPTTKFQLFHINAAAQEKGTYREYASDFSTTSSDSAGDQPNLSSSAHVRGVAKNRGRRIPSTFPATEDEGKDRSTDDDEMMVGEDEDGNVPRTQNVDRKDGESAGSTDDNIPVHDKIVPPTPQQINGFNGR